MREVSRATSIPETFLAKIFQKLASKGLVRSRRGFRGGFRLARPARRITLREIVEALEGPIRFHRCLDHLRDRSRRGRCHVRQVLVHINTEEPPVPLDTARRVFERRVVATALARHAGHRAGAARELGLTRQGLAKLVRRLGLHFEEDAAGVA